MAESGTSEDQRSIPPPPPEPSFATTRNEHGVDIAFNLLSDEPLLALRDEHWEITSVSPKAALYMLAEAVQALAEATGDVPPTPPVSRPTTPNKESARSSAPLRRNSSPDAATGAMHIGSPEAHPHEPINVDIGAGAEDIARQRVAIARRFFSRTAPPFSLIEYLKRLHIYCPHSPGVYLAAANYCHRLCVAELAVPATNRTIHRLCLAAIRVAAKALEDNKWPQDRVALTGGVSRIQLMNLELTMCYLLDFELGVTPVSLARGIFLLQQAARQNLGVRGRLNEAFRLRLPLHRRNLVTAG